MPAGGVCVGVSPGGRGAGGSGGDELPPPVQGGGRTPSLSSPSADSAQLTDGYTYRWRESEGRE